MVSQLVWRWNAGTVPLPQPEEVLIMRFLLPIPIFLTVAVALMGVLRAGRRLFPGTVGVRHGFRCPFRDEDVGVDFKEAVWDGSLLDVAACSAFSPPEDVRCDKACLTLESFPAATAEVGAAHGAAASSAASRATNVRQWP